MVLHIVKVGDFITYDGVVAREVNATVEETLLGNTVWVDNLIDGFNVRHSKGFGYYICWRVLDGAICRYLWHDGRVYNSACPTQDDMDVPMTNYGYWETEQEAQDFLNKWGRENGQQNHRFLQDETLFPYGEAWADYIEFNYQ